MKSKVTKQRGIRLDAICDSCGKTWGTGHGAHPPHTSDKCSGFTSKTHSCTCCPAGLMLVVDAQVGAFLQKLADLAYWGPKGPEGGNSPDAPTFTHPDATIRIGLISGELLQAGFVPKPRPVPPSAS